MVREYEGNVKNDLTLEIKKIENIMILFKEQPIKHPENMYTLTYMTNKSQILLYGMYFFFNTLMLGTKV